MKRITKVDRFTKVDVKEAVTRDLPLRYDEETGYLGLAVASGKELMRVTPYDRIVVLRRSGVYTVMDVPDKVFVDKGLWYCGFSEKEELSKVLFTVVYRYPKTGFPCIKRCRISGYILNRDYFIAPEGAEVLFVSTKDKCSFTVNYVPKPRLKTLSSNFKAQEYPEKGLKAQGVRLANREVESVTVEVSTKASSHAPAEASAPAEKKAPAKKTEKKK